MSIDPRSATSPCTASDSQPALARASAAAVAAASIEIDNDYSGAFPGKHLGDSLTYSSSAAGDDGNPALDVDLSEGSKSSQV